MKHFRSKYDNEFPQTESIMTNADINNKKKDVDKLLLDSIRMCIVQEDYEKVFSYIDSLYFT